MVSRVRFLLFVFAFGLFTSAAVAQTWIAQGPGPTTGGQDEGIPTTPVSGAVQAIAVQDANTFYIATVNGGVWKTTNGSSASPTWTPLTDQALPSISMGSIAISPLDSNTIFAGTGSLSSDAFDGSPGIGVAKSTNGGSTWSVLAGGTFTGRRIVSIVPTSVISGGQVVLAATLFDKGGLYRSTDGGTTFTRISGSAGLPDGGVSSIAADPGNTSRFYAGVPRTYLNGGSAGVYISTDAGATWGPVNTGISAAVLNNSLRILLSAGPATGNPVYAAFISNNAASGVNSGHLSGIFRSGNQGGSWTSMTLPSPEIYPGAQGILHGALVAHPTDANVVFLSGDRQNSPFPNANGCNNFGASVFRGDASGPSWANVVCNGANATSPHADTRSLMYDGSGNILLGCDGGIFRLLTPDTAGTRTWTSANSNLQPTEFISVAYDPFSNIIIGGAQDTGTPMQTTTSNTTWFDWIQGDGGVVAVDADQTAHAGNSLRYTSFDFLANFNRSSWNVANAFLGFNFVGLNITSGAGTGQTLFAFDPNIQFYNPYVLNKITPSRMLIGTANIYESQNKGDSLTNLVFTGFFIGALAYGGKLSGTPNPDVFYVGAGNTIFHRVTVGSITTLGTYPGGTVRSLVMDPNNYQTLYVLDSSSRVFMTQNEGDSWVNITANLGTLTSDARVLEFYSPSLNARTNTLMVGGLGGVFMMRRPGAAGTSWFVMGTGLPHALVTDLHYDYTANVLLAGTLGRGAWLANNPFNVSPPSSQQPAQSAPQPPPILIPAPPPRSSQTN